jgi:hypothetical protein
MRVECIFLRPGPSQWRNGSCCCLAELTSKLPPICTLGIGQRFCRTFSSRSRADTSSRHTCSPCCPTQGCQHFIISSQCLRFVIMPFSFCMLITLTIHELNHLYYMLTASVVDRLPIIAEDSDQS